MCGCLFALLAAVAPRLALLFLWLFTDLVNRAFDGFILPLLGIIFLPFTTLIYVLVYSPESGITVFGWILLCFGLLIDLGAYGGSAYGNRRRIPGF